MVVSLWRIKTANLLKGSLFETAKKKKLILDILILSCRFMNANQPEVRDLRDFLFSWYTVSRVSKLSQLTYSFVLKVLNGFKRM